MAGYKLIIISGIDGKFDEYDDSIGCFLPFSDIIKIPYRRQVSFLENISHFKNILWEYSDNICLFGWSIGAVALAFLSDVSNVTKIIMVNGFYRRSDVLSRRNIECDEEICICSSPETSAEVTIVVGEQDDKIPSSESRKILKYLEYRSPKFISCENAKHNLSSFPKGFLAEIINSQIAKI